MANDGAAQLHAVALRVARLSSTGATPAGASNMYVTNTLVRLDFTPTYDDETRVQKRNGNGDLCLDVRRAGNFTGVSIDRLEVCHFDPELTELLSGGAIVVNGGDTIGYSAPAAGADPQPNGVSIEVWTRRYVNNAPAVLPYAHWVFPRVKLRPTARSLGPDAQEVAFEGYGEENTGWGNGPANDYTADTSRAYQWRAEATAPTGSLGYVATPVQS